MSASTARIAEETAWAGRAEGWRGATTTQGGGKSVLTVYNCIVNEHNPGLVLLAGILGALASFAAISLLQHLRRARGRMRYLWAAVSAISFGFGVWSLA